MDLGFLRFKFLFICLVLGAVSAQAFQTGGKDPGVQPISSPSGAPLQSGGVDPNTGLPFSSGQNPQFLNQQRNDHFQKEKYQNEQLKAQRAAERAHVQKEMNQVQESVNKLYGELNTSIQKLGETEPKLTDKLLLRVEERLDTDSAKVIKNFVATTYKQMTADSEETNAQPEAELATTLEGTKEAAERVRKRISVAQASLKLVTESSDGVKGDITVPETPTNTEATPSIGPDQAGQLIEKRRKAFESFKTVLITKAKALLKEGKGDHPVPGHQKLVSAVESLELTMGMDRSPTASKTDETEKTPGQHGEAPKDSAASAPAVVPVETPPGDA